MKDFLRGTVYAGIFVVPFIVLLVTNSMFFPFITGKNFAFRIIIEIIFAAWVLLALYDIRYRPQFSWIIAGLASLVGVMFFANLFGEYPLKSFWSNFERMEGYVTIVHVFLYVLVVGSVITTEKMWNKLFNATLVAAVVLSLYAFAQLSGNITINQGGWRLDGTLGNSSYMAVYMLFHVFIAALMLARTQSQNMRYVYGGLILLFIFLLIQTATRGAILGLTGGAILATIYIVLFSKSAEQLRKYATGALIALVLLVGLFIAFKDSTFVNNNPYLQRVATISLDEGTVRFAIWNMALEGVKERPLLGWGQGNFNYVFNAEYNAEVLHSAEPWFDRVHNIVLDWFIAGGVLGAAAYFSVLVAALYYIFFRPLFRKDDETFTVVEHGLILGLLAGYMFHLLFVFDNIVSYIFYALILAFIHAHVSTEIPTVARAKFEGRSIEQIAMPVMAFVLLLVVYVVNVPSILASRDIIHAFREQDPARRLAQFEKALSRGSFADQEIKEQLTQQTQGIIRSPQLPEAIKQDAFQKTESALLELAEAKPGDARVHVFISSFYRGTNNIEQAIEQLKIARSLSPTKQQIIFEQGLAELQNSNFEGALSFFKEAYDLDTEYNRAREYYVIGAMYAGQPELVDEIVATDDLLKQQLSRNDLAIQAVYQARQYDLLIDLFTRRVDANPNDPQLRVNLAVAHHESGDTETAISVLRQAGEDIPQFKPQGDSFIADLEAGRAPGQQAQVTVGGEQVEAQTTSIQHSP